MDVDLAWLFYLAAVIMLVIAALPVRTGRISLTLLAAATLVFAYFVLPALT